MKSIQRVPPSPEVLNMLYMQYLNKAERMRSRVLFDGPELSFAQYLEIIGFTDPARDRKGMDDPTRKALSPDGIALIDVPQKPVRNTTVYLKVLLVDFDDRTGNLPKQHYEDLLFSEGIHPTGSVNDYYRQVSQNSVQIKGTIDGWLRLPHNYAYYTNQLSGTGDTYPRNAQGMAEDAVKTALQQGILFPNELDVLDEGVVTALFIIHAGIGAERIHPGNAQQAEIWSHKWIIPNPIVVQDSPRIVASTYLTVPHDCKLGVCAHELGHLAFQWQDFYDHDYEESNSYWDGSGDWDLMSSGSYNGSENYPAHPAGLHKVQHGWVKKTMVDFSQNQAPMELSIPSSAAGPGEVVIVRSPSYRARQYLLLENRVREGFDRALPGEGLLVWRIDEDGVMEISNRAGMLLIQADGRHELENVSDLNRGDDGDPFPGSSNVRSLGSAGNINTSFPGQQLSGIVITDITIDSNSKTVSLRISFETIKTSGPQVSPTETFSTVNEKVIGSADEDSKGDLVKSAILAAAGDADTNPNLLPADTPVANKIQETAQYVVLTSYLNGILKHYKANRVLKRKEIEALTTVEELIHLVVTIIEKP